MTLKGIQNIGYFVRQDLYGYTNLQIIFSGDMLMEVIQPKEATIALPVKNKRSDASGRTPDVF